MAEVIYPPYFNDYVNEGEELLIDFLKANLPDDYYLIPNLEVSSTNRRNGRTQIWEYDLVVVAPHAIYNIENKHFRGRIEGDDNIWYHNDRELKSPLITNRIKSSVLASNLKEENYNFGRAWVQNIVTLSYPNSLTPILYKNAAKLTFQLNDALLHYIQDSEALEKGKSKEDIKDIQKDMVQYLSGNQSKKKPEEKKEVIGYEIIEILHQEENFVEFLVKPKGVSSSIRKIVKEYALYVKDLSEEELKTYQGKIQNQYKALNKIKANPFIQNVEFKFDDENYLFYEVSDYVSQNSLRSELINRTFTYDEKIKIIKNLISAIKDAHDVNVFHRDINPENIFIQGGEAILGNFGKAYFIDDDRKGYTVNATLTESNVTSYHALELLAGDASRSSDIYSLGVMIYELFTNKLPFKSPLELNSMGGRIPQEKMLSALNPNLPEWLDELVDKCVRTNEEERFDSIEELEEFLIKKSKPSSSESTPKKQKTYWDFKEGDTVGEYLIHSILGKGGYSRVFKVKHKLQGKDYALKLFNESVRIESVTDEYVALENIDHPHIVRFRWNGTILSGQYYTVTDFIEGENLSRYVTSDARLPMSRIYQLAKEILNALVYLQDREKPIIHRDIKPQNIIWERSEKFVLIDFNVAAAKEEGSVVGTPPYLAPDLVKENNKIDWDESADSFSLGITLFQLATKYYPWHPQKMPITSKAPELPDHAKKILSDEFASFLLKAVQPFKEDRFKDATEMLEALEKIGIENVLREQKAKVPITDEEKASAGNDLNIVSYLNSLYSQSKSGNFGTRAKAVESYLDRETYTSTKLDRKMIPAILDGQYKLVIITGNAGDGKTALIKQIENSEKISELRKSETRNGAKFKIDKTPFETNYDGSQDEDERANDQVLESFFRPFEGLTDYSKSEEGRIIAINEGRLVEFLQSSAKHKDLVDTIEKYFNTEGHTELPSGLLIINLNLRSVVANDDHGSLFRQQVKSLANPKLWSQCETCPIKDKCIIHFNYQSISNPSMGEEVISRLEWLLRMVVLKRELHVTMRDLRSMIAFLLTRDHTCEEVNEVLNHTDDPLDYWQYFYFNISNPNIDDSGNQDRVIKLIRETDIGEIPVPDLDRDMYFGLHDNSNYLEFEGRELDILKEFNGIKELVPSHEQSEEYILRTRELQKVFIRHQFFEGKANYELRLPYHSLHEFYNLLVVEDYKDEDYLANLEYKKVAISKAISLNEGCENEAVSEDYLVLSSTEINDPVSKSFRLFPLSDFELFVNRTTHLVQYVEYEPDSLVFRHKKHPHIKIPISLDLHEMLYFIERGYKPSVNDIQGRFMELVIFKNLLENLEYNKIIVTRDNLEYFSISKTPDFKIQIALEKF